MSLKALIDLANSRKVEGQAVLTVRNEASYVRLKQYGLEIEKRLAAKEVTPALLAKVCSI